MRSTQAKFLAALEAALIDRGLELVIDYQFANRGIARVQRPDELHSLARIEFDFQHDSATLRLIPPVHGLGRLDDDGSTRVYAQSPDTLQEVVDAYRDAWPIVAAPAAAVAS